MQEGIKNTKYSFAGMKVGETKKIESSKVNYYKDLANFRSALSVAKKTGAEYTYEADKIRFVIYYKRTA
jgi:hypothetical protein